MKRTDTYKREIRQGFKWERIKSLAREEGDVWLGTIFALTPSGKVYAPFACSNVMGCKRCGGAGEVKNRKADPVARAAASERAAELLNHLFANYGPAFDGRWPEDMRAELQDAREVAFANKEAHVCSWCSGTGSHEAAKDTDWWAALEAVVREQGLCVGRAYGDNEDGVWVSDPVSAATT